MKQTTLNISKESCIEICNIANGTFSPLKGFMDSADYRRVVEDMHLDNGRPWTIPVTLEVPDDKVEEVIKSEKLILLDEENDKVAVLIVEDLYRANYDNDIKRVFGTDDIKHPGVNKEIHRNCYRVGGVFEGFNNKKYFDSEFSLAPEQIKKIFKEKGWRNVAGFQTRNPPHRAHEYLQRVAMEIVDGIFIHPLIGWKKQGDFLPSAIIKAYDRMVKEFYPAERATLATLETPMRYAGPREAVFHAIIRRNYGCTHFIVGRDHAGVGDYYGKYEAHKLCKRFNNLGIEILMLSGPYYCKKCGTIVTEKSCPHGDMCSLSISGTQVREMLLGGNRPPEEYMRSEVADVLLELQAKNQLFVKE